MTERFRCLWAAGALCALLAAAIPPSASAAAPESSSWSPRALAADDNYTALVFAVAPDGSAAGGAALAELAALRLRAAGVRAAVGRAPPECGEGAGAGAGEGEECARAAAGALWAGRAAAALVPAAGGAAWGARLADAGLQALGEAAPEWRRACVASRPPARSLLDLAEPARAAPYRLPPGLLAAHGVECDSEECAFTPEWCAGDDETCATVLVETRAERDVLAAVVVGERLRARVLAAGPRLPALAARLAPAAVLYCERWPAAAPRPPARALGPPACRAAAPCAFELRRLVTLADVRALARHATAPRALAQLRLDGGQLRALLASAEVDGPRVAAERLSRSLPAPAAGAARVALLLPASGRREVVDARALAAAGAAAERETGLKVEAVDTACSAPRAYKYLTDALGTGEYGALAALAGPACGAAWADVARQSPAHALPLLAYSPQPPPPRPAARLALLAAGDARAPVAAWAALLAARGWRRLAALSEAGARAALDLPRLAAFRVAHTELPDTDDDAERDRFLDQWAARLAARDYRLVALVVEDARVARAALCAAARAGLTAAAGALWLLPALRPDWLAPGPCAPAALAAVAAGHLRAVPRWRAAAPAPPEAALLADVLRLWAAALARLRHRHPAALDDLHRPDLLRELIEDATTTPFTGLTGAFEWDVVEGAHVRRSPLLLQQWTNGTYVDVGRWDGARLALDERALAWATADGRPPGDGGAACALQPLADALGADCRAAVRARGRAAAARLRRAGRARPLGAAARARRHQPQAGHGRVRHRLRRPRAARRGPRLVRGRGQDAQGGRHHRGEARLPVGGGGDEALRPQERGAAARRRDQDGAGVHRDGVHAVRRPEELPAGAAAAGAGGRGRRRRGGEPAAADGRGAGRGARAVVPGAAAVRAPRRGRAQLPRQRAPRRQAGRLRHDAPRLRERLLPLQPQGHAAGALDGAREPRAGRLLAGVRRVVVRRAALRDRHLRLAALPGAQQQRGAREGQGRPRARPAAGTQAAAGRSDPVVLAAGGEGAARGGRGGGVPGGVAAAAGALPRRAAGRARARRRPRPRRGPLGVVGVAPVGHHGHDVPERGSAARGRRLPSLTAVTRPPALSRARSSLC